MLHSPDAKIIIPFYHIYMWQMEKEAFLSNNKCVFRFLPLHVFVNTPVS